MFPSSLKTNQMWDKVQTNYRHTARCRLNVPYLSYFRHIGYFYSRRHSIDKTETELLSGECSLPSPRTKNTIQRMDTQHKTVIMHRLPLPVCELVSNMAVTVLSQ